MAANSISFPKVPTPVNFKLKAGETNRIFLEAGSWDYSLSLPEGSDETAAVFHLQHPQTFLRVRSRSRASGEETPRLEVRIEHEASETFAETTVKTLATDTARPSVLGVISINEAASGCESYLSLHTLLIGETAQAWSWPALEIKNPEVKCSHSATTSTIRDEDLFYMRSRGIGLEEARNQMVEAFLNS